MENLCRGLGRKSCTGLSFRVDEKRGWNGTSVQWQMSASW
jgi:hypothetical protein